MIKGIDLRKGKTILRNGELFVVHASDHVEKGKGASYMRTKIKNLKTGGIEDVRFRVDERVEVPFIDTREYEFLYKEGASYIVMDLESFDQFPIGGDLVGDAAKWLKPNEKVKCALYEGQMISFELPFTVELEVVDTPPVVKGATATNQLKEAILETGAKIRVPPFVATGQNVRVDTRSGEYLERAR